MAAAVEAEEAAEEAVEEEPAVAVVEASVLVVAVMVPLRVVWDAVSLVFISLVAVEHETVVGRSVTPPRAHIP